MTRAVERNVGAAVPVSLTVVDTSETIPSQSFAAGVPGFSRIVVIESSGASTFDGVALEFRRSFWQGIHYRLAYAIGKATDTGALPGLAPATPEDRNVRTDGAAGLDERAPADDDQRHRLLLDFIYSTETFAARRKGVLRAVFDDWRLAATYSLQSGLPYTAFVAGDANGDGNRFNDIAPGTTRNEFRRAKRGRLDARLAREIGLGGITLTPSVDLFNVFNATHNQDVDDTLYGASGGLLFVNPRYGRTLNPADGRTAQLGLTVTF
jgi:hypothetical protein